MSLDMRDTDINSDLPDAEQCEVVIAATLVLTWALLNCKELHRIYSKGFRTGMYYFSVNDMA